MAKAKPAGIGPKSNGKAVIIVESPAKTKTISKILGSRFTVVATMGHIRDLPPKSLGIDVDNDFAVKYVPIATRRKVLDALQKAVEGAGTVYLAPDPDREGEAIAWHVAEALGLPPERTVRITFNEITAPAVTQAIETPGTLDMNLVNSQQARRILDRLVGYKISPLLWRKIARGLSAGRVQSVAVRLIVDRENEIRAFVPQEHWKIKAKLDKKQGGSEFEAELLKVNGETHKVATGAEANGLIERLRDARWAVGSIEKKKTESKPFPPFNTALMQRSAANRLGFSAKKTMREAQSLYEGVDIEGRGSTGLITYMRTDSYRLSPISVDAGREFIEREWGKQYLGPVYKQAPKKKGVQDAHEAIRPTDVNLTPKMLEKSLSRDQYKLYSLIWHQFVASLMAPAVYEVVNADVNAANTVFRANGRRLLFDGHLRASASADRMTDQILPELSVGESLNLLDLLGTQHFTQPPARFTEATLVKELEKEGIGRPSTYASIISTIQDRGYVKVEEKKFHPTELGEIVTERLVQHFTEIMDVAFTRTMEKQLDEIEEARRDWLEVVREFYDGFSIALEQALKEMDSEKNKPVESGELCPECGKPMVERMSKFGRFQACSGYPECRYVKREATEQAEVREVAEKCPECGRALVEKTGRRGKFLACPGYPECKFTRSLKAPAGELAGYIAPDQPCPKCGAPLVIRYSGRGPFLGCSKFPRCRGTAKLTPEQVTQLTELKEKGELQKPERAAPKPKKGGKAAK